MQLNKLFSHEPQARLCYVVFFNFVFTLSSWDLDWPLFHSFRLDIAFSAKPIFFPSKFMKIEGTFFFWPLLSDEIIVYHDKHMNLYIKLMNIWCTDTKWFSVGSLTLISNGSLMDLLDFFKLVIGLEHSNVTIITEVMTILGANHTEIYYLIVIKQVIDFKPSNVTLAVEVKNAMGANH